MTDTRYNVYRVWPIEPEFRGSVLANGRHDAERIALDTGLIRRSDQVYIISASLDPNPPKVRSRRRYRRLKAL